MARYIWGVKILVENYQFSTMRRAVETNLSDDIAPGE